MKEKYFELKKCKNFKEIIDLISNEFCEKIAFLSLSIWCLIPIIIMNINVFIKGSSFVCFYMGVFILGFIGILNGIIYFYKNKEKVINLNICQKLPFILLICFLIWSFISCILAENKKLSFLGTNYMYEGYITYIFYSGFFINGLIVSKNKEYIKKILYCLIISSFLLCLLTFLNNSLTSMFIENSNSYANKLYASIFSNENHFAYYLTISIICSLIMFILNKHKISRFLFFISYVLISYILIKNNTFGSYLSILITLILLVVYSLIVKKNRITITLSLFTFLVLSCFSSNVVNNFKRITNEVFKISTNMDNLYGEQIDVENDGYDELINGKNNEEVTPPTQPLICAGNSRLDLWLKGIELIKNKPLFGYGFENLGKPYSTIVVCHATDRPHNTYIQIAANTGIPGLMFYIGFLIIIFVNLIKNYKKIDEIILLLSFAVLSYLISAFFGNSMYYTSPYYIFLLGIISSSLIFTLDNRK